MEHIEQSDTFRRVYQFASETNHCVFLTGKAGTGKTTLLKYIRDNCFKQISVLAPTGVAAINAGGSTIHSFFQLPFTPFLPPDNKTYPSEQSKQLLSTIKLNNTRRNVMRQLDLLIIDEISMVRCDILDAIDVVLRSVRRRHDLPFGGVQVIMVGDMYQLPPVVRDNEWDILKEKYKSPFFFDSHVVNEVHPIYIELEKIYRQEEPVFIDLLNKVRNNLVDDASVDMLNARLKYEDHGNEAIILTTHNYMADNINTKELEKLPSKQLIYEAKVEGTFPEKSYPAEAQLKLKKGARVMFIKNDPGKRFFNGKTGYVKELDNDTIKVACEGEEFAINISPETWDNIQYTLDKGTSKIAEETLGTFKQFPLRLAWAITIHKSQGLTFDKVVIDAAKAFSSGQVYVALSRCRSLEGIILRSRINKNSLSNDEKIVSFAASKTPDDHVTHFLDDGKRNYIKNILLDIFSMKELDADIRFVERKIHELQKQFVNPDLAWITGLSGAVTNLGEISKKFGNELVVLLNDRQPGVQEKLEERIRKASAYFIEKLERIKEMLLLCPWVSESLVAAKEITLLLDDIYAALSFKIYILACGKEHFDLQEYTKYRQLYRPTEYKFKIYAAEKKQSDTSGTTHPALYAALQQLRDQICNEEGKPIYMVANRNTLMEMCSGLPTDKNGLMKISGFGKIKAETIGPRFLELINDYMDQNGLVSQMELDVIKRVRKPAAEKKVKVVKPDTQLLSFELFKKGKTVEEIAALRTLAVSTIQSHLVHFIETGELPMETLLSPDKIDELKEVMKKFPDVKLLTELKQQCNENISYHDIRCFLAEEGRMKNEE
jgi:hypothetical protein